MREVFDFQQVQRQRLHKEDDVVANDSDRRRTSRRRMNYRHRGQHQRHREDDEDEDTRHGLARDLLNDADADADDGDDDGDGADNDDDDDDVGMNDEDAADLDDNGDGGETVTAASTDGSAVGGDGRDANMIMLMDSTGGGPSATAGGASPPGASLKVDPCGQASSSPPSTTVPVPGNTPSTTAGQRQQVSVHIVKCLALYFVNFRIENKTF